MLPRGVEDGDGVFARVGDDELVALIDGHAAGVDEAPEAAQLLALPIKDLDASEEGEETVRIRHEYSSMLELKVLRREPLQKQKRQRVLF